MHLFAGSLKFEKKHAPPYAAITKPLLGEQDLRRLMTFMAVCLAILVFWGIFPHDILAQTSGDDIFAPGDKVLEETQTGVTSWAKKGAILAFIAIGIGSFVGRFKFSWLAAALAGLFFVLGGPKIVTWMEKFFS